VQDNGGYGCINRLQQATGGVPFNNLLRDCVHGPDGVPAVDFAAHARALGAHGRHVRNVDELEAALREARAAERTSVLVIDTDPATTTDEGGCWWEVAVPEVSSRAAVNRARADYETAVGNRAAAAAKPDTRRGQ
jgi:3D-(3,5/4)-trihydroxycyclohexane-1,2-dione acylhydrolase (decyclizing)